jgi:hypothetical protein
MFHEFLTSNRNELIQRCKHKVGLRHKPSGTPEVMNHGVPLFLQQLIETLSIEQSISFREADNPLPTPAPTEIGRAAALHGAELLRLGYSIDQVVHEYGDICQAATEMAVEQNEDISADEFRTLNRCLDNAMADAVTAFGAGHQILINDQEEFLYQHLNTFWNEHQRLIEIAIQAYSVIKTGNVGISGATGTLLLHTLNELHSLTERAIPQIRQAFAVSPVAMKTGHKKIE